MDTYELKDIDVGFDFTSDTAHYWDGFWKEDDLGWSKKDPDSKSPTLRRYHQLLWSRRLPCGQCMQLTDGRSRYYLRWDEFYMGSDSILVSFRHSDKREVLDAVRNMVPDYHSFVEKYVRDFYTIGGMMLFRSTGIVSTVPAVATSVSVTDGTTPWNASEDIIREVPVLCPEPWKGIRNSLISLLTSRDLWTFSSCRIVWMGIMRRSTCGWVRISLRRILILTQPVNILPG